MAPEISAFQGSPDNRATQAQIRDRLIDNALQPPGSKDYLGIISDSLMLDNRYGLEPELAGAISQLGKDPKIWGVIYSQIKETTDIGITSSDTNALRLAEDDALAYKRFIVLSKMYEKPNYQDMVASGQITEDQADRFSKGWNTLAATLKDTHHIDFDAIAVSENQVVWNAVADDPTQMPRNPAIHPVTAEPAPAAQPEAVEGEVIKPVIRAAGHSEARSMAYPEMNEDSYFSRVVTNSDGEPAYSLGVVIDGMGGITGGREASITASKAMQESLNHQSLPSSTDFISDLMFEAEAAILKKRTNGETVGNACAAIACIREMPDGTHTLFYGSLGDSRVYIYEARTGKLRKVSKDQSAVADIVDENDIPIKGKEEQYYSTRNQVADGLGVYKDPSRFTNVGSVDIKFGDIVLLTSDGVTDYLTRPELENFIKQSLSKGESAEQISNNLVMKVKNDYIRHDNEWRKARRSLFGIRQARTFLYERSKNPRMDHPDDTTAVVMQLGSETVREKVRQPDPGLAMDSTLTPETITPDPIEESIISLINHFELDPPDWNVVFTSVEDLITLNAVDKAPFILPEIKEYLAQNPDQRERLSQTVAHMFYPLLRESDKTRAKEMFELRVKTAKRLGVDLSNEDISGIYREVLASLAEDSSASNTTAQEASSIDQAQNEQPAAVEPEHNALIEVVPGPHTNRVYELVRELGGNIQPAAFDIYESDIPEPPREGQIEALAKLEPLKGPVKMIINTFETFAVTRKYLDELVKLPGVTDVRPIAFTNGILTVEVKTSEEGSQALAERARYGERESEDDPIRIDRKRSMQAIVDRVIAEKADTEQPTTFDYLGKTYALQDPEQRQQLILEMLKDPTLEETYESKFAQPA